MMAIIAPRRCRGLAELHRPIMYWELRIAEHGARLGEIMSGSMRSATLNMMLPEAVADILFDVAMTGCPEFRARVTSFLMEDFLCGKAGTVPM